MTRDSGTCVPRNHRLVVGGNTVEGVDDTVGDSTAGRMSDAGNDVQLRRRPGPGQLPGNVGRTAQVEAPVHQNRRDVGDPLTPRSSSPSARHAA